MSRRGTCINTVYYRLLCLGFSFFPSQVYIVRVRTPSCSDCLLTWAFSTIFRASQSTAPSTPVFVHTLQPAYEARAYIRENNFKVASYSFLTARNLVTRKWLIALKFARSTRGSPTRKVSKQTWLPNFANPFFVKIMWTYHLFEMFTFPYEGCKFFGVQQKVKLKKNISHCSE